jgi:polysaccharide export outer membrane protein
LLIKRETTQRQLLDSLSQISGQDRPGSPVALTFSINRRVNGNIEQLAASESTLLQPGDVVRVTRSLPGMPEPSSDDKTSSLTSDEQAGTDQ